jgi:hypothetical protein
LTSGGAGGQAVPTSADDVFFSSLSTGACTISAGNTGAKSIDCTGFTGTLTGTAAITVSGGVTLAAGMTFTYSGPLTINGTGTITSAGKTFSPVTVSAASSTVTLGDAFTQGSSSTRSFTLLQGTLALAGFNLTCGVFISSGGSARAISFGTGRIILTHNTGTATVLSMGTMTNFSWTGSTGTEGFSYTRTSATGTGTIAAGSTAGGTVSNAVNVTLSAASNSITTQITTGSYIKNLQLGPSSSNFTLGSGTYNACGNLDIYDPNILSSINLAPTFLASGTLRSGGTTNGLGSVTVNGSGITVTLIGPLALATTRTFTLTSGTLNLNGSTLSTGIFSSSNSNTRAITFGSSNIELYSTTASAVVLDMATATGFTYTGTGGFIRNMAATATVRFGSTAGGTTSNAPNLAVNAGASALAITVNSWFKDLIFTGSTSTVTAPTVFLARNLTLASGGTYTAVVPTFRSGGTITSVGKALGDVTINAPGSTVTLADPLTSSGELNLTAGTFANPSNYGVTAFNFRSNAAGTRSLSMGTSTWTITGGDAVASWVVGAANLFFNAGTSTINLTYVGTKEFFGDTRTYYNVNIGGTGDFFIYGENTFNNITNSVRPATVIFESGTTTTVANFGLSGIAGNLITISSEAAGFQFTLSKASGTVNAQYLSIQDSIATGGATWNSLTLNGNVDAGNNTGWIFNSAGLSTSNMLLMFLP